MKSVFIVESNPNLDALWTLNLKIYVDVNAETKKLAEFAIKQLEEKGEFPDAVITRKDIKSEKTYEILKKYFALKKVSTPMVVISPEPPDDLRKGDLHVTNCLDLKNIIRSTSQIVGMTAAEMAKKKVEEFYPIPVNFFMNLNYLVCDLFLEDLDTPGKFNKKFNAGITLSPELISQIIEQGFPFMYVEKNNRLKLVNSISEEIIAKLDSGELSVEEKLVFSDKMLGSLGKKLLRQGFDPQSIIQAKNMMDSVKKVAKKESRLKKLLATLLNNEASYRFKHVQLITLFGVKMIAASDWGSDKQEEKFIFAATMHDVTLLKDSHAKIHSLKELEEAKLDPADKAKVLNHASDAVTLIGQFPKAPMGVENIILKHHGSMNGKGFAEYASTTLTPVELAFFVAEEYARIILSKPINELDQEKAIEELTEKFPTSRFRKMREILAAIKI